jgi:hypothetical protein
MMLAVLAVLASSAWQFAAAQPRQAGQGETCNSLRKSCVNSCTAAGSGGGALKKKCIEQCGLSLDACTTSGTWSNGDVQVKGLPK